MGTPAEEGGMGKVHLLRGGAFEKIDVAMMAHPSRLSEAASPCSAMVAVTLELFCGQI